MQYDYILKTDLNGNIFIEFSLVNNIYGYNYYEKDFLNDLLLVFNEIKPTLRNNDDYWNFDVLHNDETTDDEIREKFEKVLDTYFDPAIEGQSKKLVIETIKGKILFEEDINGKYILTSENNSELIIKKDFLKNSIVFNNNS